MRGTSAALEFAAWGRRRWNVENGFKVVKHGGFGLEHTFCNDDTVGRNYHVLMQIAYVLWQVFDTGVLSRLSEGCRQPTQEMWTKLLFLALLVLGLASVPRLPIPHVSWGKGGGLHRHKASAFSAPLRETKKR